MPGKPTTPDLVEVVRSFAESAPNDLEAFLGFFAEDASWEGVPLGTTYHGRGEIRTFLTDWMGAYEEYEIEEKEVRDLGNGVVFAVVDQVTRLAGSVGEARMTEPWAFTFAWTGGHIVRASADNDIEQARATAEGLAEERGFVVSEQNVAAMWRIAQAYDRRDLPGVIAELDPRVEIDDADIPEATGTDSFLEWVNRWDQAWESWHAEDLEIRAADDGHVIGLFTMVAKGRHSGVELRRADALVARFRDGKAVKLGYYNDQTQALKAVGLEN